MSAIKILAAVYMLLVAAAVAVNFIAILFYDPPLGGGWFAYSSLTDPDPVLEGMPGPLPGRFLTL